MKRFWLAATGFLIVACTGQDRILDEDTERGIVLRQTNIETIGCWGEKGAGGTRPTVRLEFSKPSRVYSIPNAAECGGDISFDASDDPVRIRCRDEVRPFYRLQSTGVLGARGDFRPFYEAADSIVEERGQSVLKHLLTEAHRREKMVETLITLGDTDCADYWEVSFDGLDTLEQERVLDGLQERDGASEIRSKRLDAKSR